MLDGEAKTTATRQADTLVVLIAPAIAGGVWDALHATLTSGPARVRVLVSLSEAPDPVLASTLARTGRPVDWLLTPSLAPPDAVASSFSMAPGSAPRDQDALARALSDVVIATPYPNAGSQLLPFLLHDADRLGRPIVAPGDGLPCLPAPVPSITDSLDPVRPGWHSRFSAVHGRLEQALLELLAWNWSGDTACRAASRAALRRCFGRPWSASPYYGPPLAPTHAAYAPDATAPLVARFEALDRSALHGAFIYRDLIWLQDGLGSAAVIAALCGHLDLLGLGEAWSVLELLTLLCVAAFVLLARWTALQERWTPCRLGAEQLRVARICLPLAVVPGFLLHPDLPSSRSASEPRSRAINLAARVTAEVKRVVRDQGLPVLRASPDILTDAQCLRVMVADQHRYHHLNASKLERAERTLRHITTAVFWLSVAAVIAHFNIHLDDFLLITAGGPAVVAALQGAGTRLGIVHRIALSVGAAKRLAFIRDALDALIATPPSELSGSQRLRALAQDTASAMSGETEEWHSLVRREPDDFP